MWVEEGAILYSDSDNSAEAIERAKKHIAYHEFTPEDVKLVRNDNGLDIIARKRVWLKE